MQMRELTKISMTERSMKQVDVEGLVGLEREGDGLLADAGGGVAGVAAVGEVWVEAGAVEVDDEVLALGVVGDEGFFLAIG